VLDPLSPTVAGALGRDASSRTLSNLRAASGTELSEVPRTATFALSPSLSEVRAASNEPDLTIEQGQVAVAAALANGETIVLTLQQLDQLAQVAGSNGLTADITNLIDSESTRQSRLNLNVQAQNLLDAVDQLVANSFVEGVSFIASSPSEVTVQSSLLGGRVTVLSQPLDVQGLG